MKLRIVFSRARVEESRVLEIYGKLTMTSLRCSPLVRTMALLLAALFCAGLPWTGPWGEARAADATTVAVIGVFGNPDGSNAESEAMAEAVVAALADLDDVEVVGPDVFGRTLWDRRNQVLQGVFLGSAEDAFQEGRVLYDNAQFQAALISLEKAEEALDRGVEFLRDPRLLVEIHVHEGLANMALGDDGAAEAHFEEVARTDPARALDPVRTPPKMTMAFEQAKFGVAESGVANVLITSGSHVSADVYVNGLDVGRTPTNLELAPGRYHISVHHPEHGWDYVDETLEADQDVELDFVLQPRGIRPLGREKTESPRSRRIQALYASLAETISADLLLLSSLDEGGNLELQLYSPRSDVFSRVSSATALIGGRPDEDVVAELVDEVVSRTDTSGSMHRDDTSTKTVPVYIGRNPVLNELLTGPQPAERVVVVAEGGQSGGSGRARKPVHKQPAFWIILGSAVAGGVAASIAAASAGGETPDPIHEPGNGTVTVIIGE